MVLVNFLFDFPPRMARSRMSFSSPPKLTERPVRTAPSTLGQGHQEGGDELFLASLALAIICLRNILACDWDSETLLALCVCVI